MTYSSEKDFEVCRKILTQSIFKPKGLTINKPYKGECFHA